MVREKVVQDQTELLKWVQEGMRECKERVESGASNTVG